nr:MAG TPA: hypothetical protein [Caudoviricetes sp.]DAR09307.1 MAG TPA: hypothetical protein [Caudoviricetes sp.]
MKFGKFKPWNECHEDGEYYEFHFKNGYGASVIRGPHDELFELDVLKRNRRYPRYWDIYYMPITNDGTNMEYDDVVNTLEDISHMSDDELPYQSIIDHDGYAAY